MDRVQIELQHIQEYLERRAGAAIQIEEVRPLGAEPTGTTALKQFAYGRPLLVRYRAGDQTVQVVFHHIRRNAFGREREDDRVAAIWLDYNTFNRLPRHVPALDMVIRTKEGEVRSISSAQEVLLVTAYRPGRPYAEDLVRIRDEGRARPLDINRAEVLAGYLAEIHQAKCGEKMLWQRRLRDLVGHGEGIMGLTDSYREGGPLNEGELRDIEEVANRWRRQLKPLSHRLSQVHGDFHPFNILFEDELQFHVLDRSRGEWGEPADDVSCLTINYLFFSLQRSGLLEGSFQVLHDRFWECYLSLRPDEELPAVIQPWFAWRALVLASPMWYPTLPDEVRRKLLGFARRVLTISRYDYHEVNHYLADD
jgi:hypothetical protein